MADALHTGGGPFKDDCSLAELRREIHCGFEALQAKLQQHQEALLEVRRATLRNGSGDGGVPGLAAPEDEHPALRSYESEKSYVQPQDNAVSDCGGAIAAAGKEGDGEAPGGDCSGSTKEKANNVNHRQWIQGHVDSDDSCESAFWGLSEKWVMLRRRARHIVDFRFDCLFGAVVVLNSACVGLEVQASLDGYNSTALKAIEYICLCLFVIELVLRSLANHKKYLFGGWFFLDVVLVGGGIIAAVVAESTKDAIAGQSTVADAVQSFIVLRALRLLRLARAFRRVEAFQEVCDLSFGLLRSARIMISACVMLFLTIYVFSCLGLEIIRESEALRQNPVTNQIVQERFSSLLRTMLTLLSFANADSIAGLYEPMIEASPMLVFFFGALWLLMSVSLMNLVTAVIVDSAITQSKEDEEARRVEMRKKARNLLPEIKDLFINLGGLDGVLEYDEVDLSNVKLHSNLRDVIDEEKLKDLFEWLDMDRSGSVDMDEFVDGILHLAMQDVPIETTQSLQLMRATLKGIEGLQDSVQILNQKLASGGSTSTTEGWKTSK